MDDAITCEICCERFSSGKHDPLALPCGHTFCRMCLNNLLLKKTDENKSLSCPTCRRIHTNTDIDQLPIIYKLISIDSIDTTEEYEVCSCHGDELTYWCHTCNENLCGLCLFNNHPQDHHIAKKKVTLVEKKYNLKSNIDIWQRDIEVNHKIALRKTFSELRKLYQSQSQLCRTKRIIGELVSEIDVASSLTTVHEIEAKINSLKMVFETLSISDSPVDSTSEGSQRGLDKDKTVEESESFLKSMAKEQESGLCGYIQNADGRLSTVEWHGDLLLMSAFSESPSTADLLLKLPSQVFLQLSIKGDQYLGQVIIQPFFHLRRAKMFTALCLGTFGVSYLGSPFRSVENKNRPREYLSGGFYINPKDGALTNRDLMNGLEWDGEAAGESIRGSVLGVAYNNGESGFGICTRTHEGSTFKCHFADVVSGMDVVQAAVNHHPISNIIISKCGLVVPNLFS